jgi:hypothetical protein
MVKILIIVTKQTSNHPWHTVNNCTLTVFNVFSCQTTNKQVEQTLGKLKKLELQGGSNMTGTDLKK